MKVVVSTSIVLLLAMPGPGARTVQAPEPAGRAGLAGTWQLDRESSDLASPDALDGHGGGMRGRPPGAGPGGRPPGMDGPSGGRRMPAGGGDRSRPSDEDVKRMRELVQEALALPTRMTIARDGDAVVFIDEDGHTRRYVPNGKTEKHQLTAGTVETKTRWNGPTLVIETEVRDGMKLERSYALEPGTGRLIVTTAPGGRGSSDDRPPLTGVYDPVS